MALSDQLLEKLLKVLTPFVLSELEEVVTFSDKNDQQREEIMKASIKSLEVSCILCSKLFDSSSLNEEMVEQVLSLIDQNKMDEASDIINERKIL